MLISHSTFDVRQKTSTHSNIGELKKKTFQLIDVSQMSSHESTSTIDLYE